MKKGDWVRIETDSFPHKGLIFGRYYKIFEVKNGCYYVGSRKFKGTKGFPLFKHEISLKKKK